MFRKLTDFGYQRTVTQAIGFYIFYLILCSLLAGVLAGAAVQGDSIGALLNPYGLGVSVGGRLAIFMSLALSLVVMARKREIGHPGLLVLAVVGALSATLAGALLGLLVPAYLSTRPAASHQDSGL